MSESAGEAKQLTVELTAGKTRAGAAAELDINSVGRHERVQPEVQ